MNEVGCDIKSSLSRVVPIKSVRVGERRLDQREREREARRSSGREEALLVRSVSLEIKYPPAQRMRPTEEGGEGGERGIERQRTGCGGLGVWQQRVLCAGGHRGQRIIALGVERGALFGSPRAKDNKERKEHEDAIGAGPLSTGKFQRGGRHPEQAAEQAAGNSNVVRRARAAHLSGRHAIGSRRRQTHISHNPPLTHPPTLGNGERGHGCDECTALQLG